MADSAGGNSTADAKKKATALDEDFGKDFLSFWGSSKKGKDKIDFDMDEVTRNTKKSFNFDKLDDFELGGDFDKLPSFKVDMPDLDFSSPGMNNDKSTEKHIGKKDSRKENFSFNFDFNEGSAAVNPKSLNDKLASALQLNSLRVSAENASRRTLSPTKRRQDFVYNNKLESLNICPANDSIESNENQDQAETWKVSISKSSGEGSIKCISQRDDDQSDTSRFQVDHSDLQQSPTATNSARLAHNFLSSTASMKCLKIAPVEISGAFLKDKTNCDNRLTISSLKKLDSDSPNSATLKAAKSVRFSERRLEFPLKMASKTAHSVLTEKSGPTDLLLKMKTVEVLYIA